MAVNLFRNNRGAYFHLRVWFQEGRRHRRRCAPPWSSHATTGTGVRAWGRTAAWRGPWSASGVQWQGERVGGHGLRPPQRWHTVDTIGRLLKAIVEHRPKKGPIESQCNHATMGNARCHAPLLHWAAPAPSTPPPIVHWLPTAMRHRGSRAPRGASASRHRVSVPRPGRRTAPRVARPQHRAADRPDGGFPSTLSR